MSNNRITPFVKRMRTTGGTIYTFSSAVEDIGLNINERNNVVKISHFALLNIPKINEPDTLPNNEENRFNILAIPSAFEYWKTQNSIKDGRVLIAESFQNYALNFEANLLNQSTYDPTLSKTVSERVFWKWLKETGAIRWANPSDGYWMETEDADGSLGYNTVVKYFGAVSAGNVRQDSFGTYNETYILVPTSHGQMEPYFEQIEDNNYKFGIKIEDLGENILGRDGWTRPHPDGLSFLGYYDYVDSSAKVWNGGTYNMTVNGVPGGWYSAEGINPTAENCYFTDASNFIYSGNYDVSIKYDNGGDSIQFKRSKIDCMSLVLDINKLQTRYPTEPNLTFDKLATELAINDTFEFNAVMIYYSIYNSVQDTILATNLLGVLFLDAPSGSTQNIGDGFEGILLPSLEKIQSGPTGFGTSYNLRLNIKSDNMVDDTTAIIVDAATSDQLAAADWSQAFYELEKAVNILTQNNSVLQYISGQYMTLQNNQTQMLNAIQQLQYQVNDIGKDITGTPGSVAMFSAGDDPLIETSIYMAAGKIGFFNNQPTWPVQIDASLKTKDIYIEKAIRDVSGNNLLSWGSPLRLGSSTNLREVEVYSGNLDPAISVDTNNNVSIPKLGNFLKESSLGIGFAWNPGTGLVDVSMVGGGGSWNEASINQLWTKDFAQDAALALTRAEYIPSASTGAGLAWSGGYLTATGGGGSWNEASINQIWSSQSAQDTVISGKQPVGDYATNSALTLALKPYATNASIGLAGFAKTSQLSLYLPLTGGSITGPVSIADGFTLATNYITMNGGHIEAVGNTAISSTASEVRMTFIGYSTGIPVTPKGNKILVMFNTSYRPQAANSRVWTYIRIQGGIYNASWPGTLMSSMQHNSPTTASIISMQKMIPVVPGTTYTVTISWMNATGTPGNMDQSSLYGNRVVTIQDLY